MRRLSLFFLITLLLYPVCSYADSVNVRLASPERIQTKPGAVVTARFLIINNTENKQDFFEDISLPAGWQMISSQDETFQLGAGQQQLRLVSVLVPPTTIAGRYKVNYLIRSKIDSGISDYRSFLVEVITVEDTQAQILKKPGMIIAGQDYKVELQLFNKGNTETKMTLEIESIPDYRVEIAPSELVLGPGEHSFVVIKVKTKEDLEKRINHILKVRVKSDDKKLTELTSVVKVVPRMTGKYELFHKVSSELRLIFLREDSKGPDVSLDGSGNRRELNDYQIELSGSGSLDEEGRRKVDFLFRTPDSQDLSPYGEHDEYFFNYRDDMMSLHLGDRSYSLSPLTESYYYGRGAEFNFYPDRLGIGTFYVQSRWDRQKEERNAYYVKYDLADTVRLKGNFLEKRIDAKMYRDRIYSFQTDISPDNKTDIELEYAFNDSKREQDLGSYAYRFNVVGEFFDDVTYSLRKIHAEPEYFGFYNDEDLLTASLNFPVYKKLKANFYYRDYKDNLDLNPLQEIADRERFYRAGLVYPLPFGTRLLLDYEDFQKKDVLLPASFDHREKSIRFGLGQGFKKMSFQGYVERGRLKDRISRTVTDTERYWVYFNFNPTPRQRYSFFTRIGHDKFSDDPQRTKTAGFSALWQLANNLTCSVSYSKIDFDSGAGKSQDKIETRLVYKLPNDHSLELNTYWLEYNDTQSSDFAIFLAYTIPWDIPVSKKKSIGVLRGRIFDVEAEGKPSLSNVVLMVDGAVAVTDKRGEFMFPALKPGKYYIQFEKETIGLDKVADEKMPIEVEIKGAQTTEVEIGIVTSGKISGRVIAPAVTGDKTFIDRGESFNRVVDDSDDHGKMMALGNVLVEIREGEEIIRQLTDSRGMFSFEDIRPGSWTLTVYRDNLPAHYYPEEERLQIELSPGQEETVNIRILPRHRSIQIIDEGLIEER